MNRFKSEKEKIEKVNSLVEELRSAVNWSLQSYESSEDGDVHCVFISNNGTCFVCTAEYKGFVENSYLGFSNIAEYPADQYLQAEKELQKRKMNGIAVSISIKELEFLRTYQNETVWRLTTDDIEAVLEKHLKNVGISSSVPSDVLEFAKEQVLKSFSIYDYSEYLEGFLEDFRVITDTGLQGKNHVTI